MPLVDKIQKDMYKAMKEKEKERINALRNIIGKLKYRYIDKGDKLTEQEEIKVIQSLAKQRRESIDAYESGGRLDLAEREAAEIVIIENYLPRQLDEDEIANAVRGVIEKLGSSCIKDTGRTMAALKAAYSGQMDFSKVGNMVKEYLTSAR